MHPFVTIGNMEMPTYLACGVVGLTASMVMGIRLLAYRGMLRKSFSSMLISLPAILFGGRLFSALSLLVDRLVHKMPVDVIQLLSEGGIVYWGGLLAYTLMVLAICRLRNVSIRPVLDVLAVCTPLFHSIARIGCLLRRVLLWNQVGTVWAAIPYRPWRANGCTCSRSAV